MEKELYATKAELRLVAEQKRELTAKVKHLQEIHTNFCKSKEKEFSALSENCFKLLRDKFSEFHINQIQYEEN
jgi:hypothetical protein